MRSWWRWVLLGMVCAGVPFVLGSSGCGGGVLSIDDQTEIKIGKQAAAETEQKYRVIDGTPDAERVERIGKAIAAGSERKGIPWSYKVLDMKDVNAFSLPGGPVYVCRGLLETGLSDDELAGVLGHETAHINQRHSAKAIQRAMTMELLSNLALRNSGSIMQSAAGLAMQYGMTLPRSREDEYEADSVGLRLAYNAGYPADGLVKFLKKLDKLSGAGGSAEWMQTHPDTKARVARAQRLADTVAPLKRPVPLITPETESAANRSQL